MMRSVHHGKLCRPTLEKDTYVQATIDIPEKKKNAVIYPHKKQKQGRKSQKWKKNQKVLRIKLVISKERC